LGEGLAQHRQAEWEAEVTKEAEDNDVLRSSLHGYWVRWLSTRTIHERSTLSMASKDFCREASNSGAVCQWGKRCRQASAGRDQITA